MADQDTVPENTIPPKVAPFAKTQGLAPVTGAAPTPPATVRVQPIPSPAPSAAPTPLNPRRTSRIPLTGVIPPMMAATAPAGQSRTIRIKPVGPQPGSSPISDGPRPPTEAQVQAAKSKTSRISLDDAIGAGETLMPAMAQAAAEAPKTIRLKRPTEMPTVKVAVVPSPSATSALTSSASTAPAKSTAPISQMPAAPASQTSRIADTTMAQDNTPITQKRTIRVKRPAAVVFAGGAASEAEAQEGGGLAGAPLVTAVAPDKAHAMFIVAAIVTILVTIGLAVVISSQIFGPNASLTELSIWPTGPDLPLPGTVSGN